MALPFFYSNEVDPSSILLVLDENTSKHVVQVLRMQNGERLQLTDGKGNIYTCEITDNHRKKCSVSVTQRIEISRHAAQICIAISPVKNNSRFEWFLEKATEIGVTQIVPLICERTEKQQLKTERLNGILISAMLQSQQAWLPVLTEPAKFADYVASVRATAGLQKFIAHCEDDQKETLAGIVTAKDSTILIGPEGDFTNKEIELALQSGFAAVSLGTTRLRTETAGMVAAVLLRQL